MKKIPLTLAAVTLLSACTTAAHTAATASSPPVAASASAGCAQATAAVTAARERINAQDYGGATTRIADLRDTAHGKVAIDAAFAATDLAFLNYDATAGNPVDKDLTDSLAALDKIDADCGA
jgi:hypothetical protein